MTGFFDKTLDKLHGFLVLILKPESVPPSSTKMGCEEPGRSMRRGASLEPGQGRRLTSEQDLAKEAVILVHGVAVPTMLAELMLTLCCPFGHTLAYGTHHVRVSVAQLTLAAHQSGHIVTHHPGGVTCDFHLPGKDRQKGET